MNAHFDHSFLRSWSWDSPSCKPLCDFLRKRILDGQSWETLGETIWKTRHKEVELYRVAPEFGNFRVAIKNYHERRFWRYFLRPSLACREAKGFAVAYSLGIPSAEVLTFGEERKGLRLVQAFFVTRFEESTGNLLDFAPGQPQEDKRDILLSLLARNMSFMAALHKAGFLHGGAHPRNFLWRMRTDDQTPNVNLIWIDLATVKPYHFWNKTKAICQDLTDMLEAFRLSQQELDTLANGYNKSGPMRVKLLVKDVSHRKFNVCLPE